MQPSRITLLVISEQIKCLIYTQEYSKYNQVEKYHNEL